MNRTVCNNTPAVLDIRQLVQSTNQLITTGIIIHIIIIIIIIIIALMIITINILLLLLIIITITSNSNSNRNSNSNSDNSKHNSNTNSNNNNSSLTNEVGTPRPQLEPQITSLNKCEIKQTVRNTSLLDFWVGVGGSYSIGEIRHASHWSWPPLCNHP